MSELSVSTNPEVPSLAIGCSYDGKAAVICLNQAAADVLVTLVQRGLKNMAEGQHIAEHVLVPGATLTILP
ncbi:MAG: hypothetical protein ACLQIJ_06540 [Polyangia bacterium]